MGEKDAKEKAEVLRRFDHAAKKFKEKIATREGLSTARAVKMALGELDKFRLQADIDLEKYSEMNQRISNLLSRGSFDREIALNKANRKTVLPDLLSEFENCVVEGPRIIKDYKRNLENMKSCYGDDNASEKSNENGEENEIAMPPNIDASLLNEEDGSSGGTNGKESDSSLSSCPIKDPFRERFAFFNGTFQEFQRAGKISLIVEGRDALALADPPYDMLNSSLVAEGAAHIARALDKGRGVARMFCGHMYIRLWIDELARIGLLTARSPILYVKNFDKVHRTKLTGQPQGCCEYAVVAWDKSAAQGHTFVPPDNGYVPSVPQNTSLDENVPDNDAGRSSISTMECSPRPRKSRLVCTFVNVWFDIPIAINRLMDRKGNQAKVCGEEKNVSFLQKVIRSWCPPSGMIYDPCGEQ